MAFKAATEKKETPVEGAKLLVIDARFHEAIADELVATLARMMRELRVGPAYHKTSQMGPLVNEEHRRFVANWIQRGVDEGAELVLDGRGITVPGYERGFYLGPTLFDRVTPGMAIGDEEKKLLAYHEGGHALVAIGLP